MSRSATPATRNEAMRHVLPPKALPFAQLTIGTAIRGPRGWLRTGVDGCGRLRTVADGCGRLRTVATTNAMSSEHTLNPQTPRVKRESLLDIREKNNNNSKFDLYKYKLNLYFLCLLYIIIYVFPYYLFFFIIYIRY
jgi:hypothetical protein